MNFQNDIFTWCGTHYPVEFEIQILFEKYSALTLSEIKCLLDISKIEYNEEILRESLYNLFIRYGMIIRDDYWEDEPRYHYVERYRQDSSYTKSYYSFTVDDTKNKKILLIADTHIGNSELEDFKLLRKVYDKGIELGATKCFHLGDIFAGKYHNYSDKAIENQLTSFIEKYPNPTKEEMMTYALLGNHDEWIRGSINHIAKYKTAYYYDLRCLSKYRPSFMTFQRNKWQTSFGNISMIFSHRLYIGWIFQDKRLYQLEEMDEEKEWMDSEHQVLVSGHLHCGFIYSAEALKYSKDDKIFIGVPSTSARNIGGTVAHIISINYDGENPINMEITPLNCDRNYLISEGEPFEWNFREKNKVYQKKFNLNHQENSHF